MDMFDLLPFLLLAVLGEILPNTEAYKFVRPYKFYSRRPHHKPRWHPNPLPPKWRPPKRRPRPQYYPSYRPKRPRYPSHFENSVDYATDERPYTIEIELPKRHGSSRGQGNGIYHRGYDRGTVYDEPEEDDYLDEDYNEQDRVIRAGNKRLRIKVVKGPKPKLNIKISRVDDTDANATDIRPSCGPNITTNIKELGIPRQQEWVPANPKQSFPVHLRGA